VSMFMVSKTHIDVLVTVLLRSEAVPEIAGLSGDQIGLGLWLENWNSGKARYPRAWGEHADQWPESTENLDVVQAYRYEPVPLSTAPSAGSAYRHVVDCYCYQACEHPTWDRSPAYRWMTRLAEVLGDANGNPHDLRLWEVPDRETWIETVAKLDAGSW